MVTVRPFRTEDAADAYRLRRLAFGGPREVDTSWADDLEGFSAVVAELDGALVGFTNTWHYRQFFGGNAVPMGGIASVAVAPHARGRGAAGAMLDASLIAMREQGVSISALYPYVTAPYRKRGWERAGIREEAVIPLAALATTPRSNIEVRPGTEADLDE